MFKSPQKIQNGPNWIQFQYAGTYVKLFPMLHHWWESGFLAPTLETALPTMCQCDKLVCKRAVRSQIYFIDASPFTFWAPWWLENKLNDLFKQVQDKVSEGERGWSTNHFKQRLKTQKIVYYKAKSLNYKSGSGPFIFLVLWNIQQQWLNSCCGWWLLMHFSPPCTSHRCFN